MKILVVGSTSYDGYERIRRKYMSACRQIGEALARAKHTLVLGSDATTTVERQVLEGYSSVDGRRSVIIVGPKNGKTPFARARNALKDRISFTYRTTRATGYAGRVHQIMAADGVIILGGSRGEGQMGYSAPALKRPVVAVPSFGGAARELWEEFEADYRLMKEMKEQCSDLRDRWSPGCADLAVQLITQLVKHNPYRSRTNLPQGILLTVLLVLTWILLRLVLDPFWADTMELFLVLGVAALVGTGLRTTLRIRTEGAAVLSLPEVLTDGALGIILAFGLSLAYFTSGALVTGGASFLANPDPNEYERIAFTLVPLGFATGLLRENAIDRLIHFFGRFLANAPKGVQ